MILYLVLGALALLLASCDAVTPLMRTREAVVAPAVPPTAAPTAAEKEGLVAHAREMEKRMKQKLSEWEKKRAEKKTQEKAQAETLQKEKHGLATQVEQMNEMMHRLDVHVKKAAELVKDAEGKVLRDLGYGMVSEENLPRAIYAEGKPRPQECPTLCDPAYCDDVPDAPTHCFHAVRQGQKTVRKCRPFDDPETLKCPTDFVLCSLVAPDRGRSFTIPVSTQKRPIYEEVDITGINLHQCLRLAFIPPEVPCTVDTASQAINASLAIMGFGSSASYPHIEDGKAQFKGIQVIQEGNFTLCLVQFTRAPSAKTLTDIRLVGAEVIGTVQGVLPKTTTSTRTTGGPGGNVTTTTTPLAAPPPANTTSPIAEPELAVEGGTPPTRKEIEPVALVSLEDGLGRRRKKKKGRRKKEEPEQEVGEEEKPTSKERLEKFKRGGRKTRSTD